MVPSQPGWSAAMAEATPPLAEDLRMLEDIVRRLEQEDIDLDQALQLFEEGVARLRRARETLAAADEKVRAVLVNADGDLRQVRVDL
jgi:exodeoxyribonuclease VII small subunit